MATHQLQVGCRPGKVRRSETDVLPLSYTTNITTCLELVWNLEFLGVKAHEEVGEHHDADGGKDGKVRYHHTNLYKRISCHAIASEVTSHDAIEMCVYYYAPPP